jgi:HEAT repeat protein
MLVLPWLSLQLTLLAVTPDVGVLVAKLSSPSPSERQGAAKALTAIGPTAMPPMMEAISGYDRGQLAIDTAVAQALVGG